MTESLPGNQVDVDWLSRLADGLAKAPWPWFCALLVVAVAWLARQNAREREAHEVAQSANAVELAKLSRDYGATMVRLEHVLAGLTRMRDEYKRLLAELVPKKAPRDESRP